MKLNDFALPGKAVVARCKPRQARAWLSAAALASAVALLAIPASAITIDESQIERDSRRPDDQDPFTISLDDCQNDNDFTFTVASLTVGDTLSVWVTESADCTDLKTRNDGLCKQVIAAFQLADLSMDLEVKAADVANGITNVIECADSGAADAPRPVKLYFLVNETTDPVTDYLAYETRVDLLGPPPPTDVSLAVADSDKLTVSYAAPTSSTDVLGYRFFAQEAGPSNAAGGSGGGPGGAAPGGGSPTGGTGGSDSGTSDCTAPDLVPGEVPPSATEQGDTTSQTDGLVQGLTEGTRYAVGVAGYDKVGNTGKLSELACGIPEPVDDFYEIYRKQGGQAGGGYCGYCALGRPVRSGWLAVGLAGLALGGLAVRRAGSQRRRRGS